MEVPVPGTEAVLIVRAWFERDHPPNFRARILGVRLNDPFASQTATTPDEVVQIVRAWLDEMLRVESAAAERPID
jgi:hypothetical protein